jgi:hypothetical protein
MLLKIRYQKDVYIITERMELIVKCLVQNRVSVGRLSNHGFAPGSLRFAESSSSPRCGLGP